MNHSSIENTALISGYHVLDIDESIFTTMNFKQFQSLLDQISQVLSLSLTVINLVSQVLILDLEQIEHWKYLSVVWHQCFTYSVGASH